MFTMKDPYTFGSEMFIQVYIIHSMYSYHNRLRQLNHSGSIEY